MYNVVCKVYLFVCLICMTLPSCSSVNSEELAAKALLASADSAISVKNYELAVELLDTLKSHYPKVIDVQREAMHIRPKAMEGLTIKEMEENDSLMALYTHRHDSLAGYFKFVNNPHLVEGYYVIKELANSTLFSRTGVEARVSPEGEFYMISSLTTGNVLHTSVGLKCKAGEVYTSSIAYDGDRNYRSSGTEMITFLGAECDTLGHFVSANPLAKMSLIFKGKRSFTTQLSSGDRKSIALSYQMANAISNLKKCHNRRGYLERRLMLTRDQQARTMAEPKSVE